MATLEEKIGQTLVIGVPGLQATPEILNHFRDLNAGGLILYRINFESPSQLKKLIRDLEEGLGRRLLVMADHEGGRVIMFRDGITVFPDNLAVGTSGKLAYARRQGEVEARELRRLGMDVNLGPVLDVLTETYSPNIGIRSYGRDWKRVAAFGSARIRAMQSGGISACAKHFPGKGHAPVDAHLGLPVIPSTWKEMESVHLIPFLRAIRDGVHCIMTSHPYYPNLDPEPGRIATFSRRIVYDTLRTRLGFEGVILSDDLEMGAISEICEIGEAAVKAVEAGHDLLLVCHDLQKQRRVFEALKEAYRSGRLSPRSLEASAERVARLRSLRKVRFEGGLPRPERGAADLAERICLESARRVRPFRRLDLKVWRRKKICVVFPRISSFDAKIMVEREVLDEVRFVKESFRPWKIVPRVEVVAVEPSPEEIARAEAAARGSDLAVCCVWDAHLYPSNRALLDAVQSAAPRTVAVLLRDPDDAEFLREGTGGITDFGWRSCQIRASFHKLFR